MDKGVDSRRSECIKRCAAARGRIGSRIGVSKESDWKRAIVHKEETSSTSTKSNERKWVKKYLGT